MRVLAVWAVLFAAYAATLGVDAVGGSDYAGDEPRHLLAAESIVSDFDIDLTRRVRHARLRGLPSRRPWAGRVGVLGRRLEPQGFGFALLISPAYALGGPTGRRAVPGRDRGARVRARRPGRAADRARAVGERRGAARRALAAGARARDQRLPRPDGGHGAGRRGAVPRCACASDPTSCSAVVGAALLALLPWLGPKFLLPAAPVGDRARALDGAARAPHGRARGGRDHGRARSSSTRRSTTACTAASMPSAVAASGAPATGADSARRATSSGCPGSPALWIDRDVGLLRWAPVLALSGFSAWLLWRSRRTHRAHSRPRRAARPRSAAGLSLLRLRSAVLVAAPSPRRRSTGEWFPARHVVAAFPIAAALAPGACATRRAPARCSARLTLLCSAWLVIALAFGNARRMGAPGRGRAVWAGGCRVLPRFGDPWANVNAAAVGLRFWRAAAGWRTWCDDATQLRTPPPPTPDPSPSSRG